MADKRSVHVVPHGDSWATTRDGNQRVSATFDTQAEAAAVARQTAKRDEVELLTHNRQGEIRDRSSYGNDPHPPKG